MNSNSNQPPKTKLVFGVWTIIWAVASVTVSLTLWTLQFHQPTNLSEGMKAQSSLLIGGRDE